MNYTELKIVGKSYQTADGKYHTKTTASNFYRNEKNEKVEYNKGYTYWFDENNIKQGSTSYDYFFFLGKEGIPAALEVLNKVKD